MSCNRERNGNGWFRPETEVQQFIITIWANGVIEAYVEYESYVGSQ